MAPDTSSDDDGLVAIQGEKAEVSIAPVCLDTEIERADGGITSEVRRVSSGQIKQARDIINRAVKEDKAAQMNAIDEAIPTLYRYNAKPGQREALHHLIYLRKDLILIAGTGFGGKHDSSSSFGPPPEVYDDCHAPSGPNWERAV
jgi:hypothetical protein